MDNVYLEIFGRTMLIVIAAFAVCAMIELTLGNHLGAVIAGVTGLVLFGLRHCCSATIDLGGGE